MTELETGAWISAQGQHMSEKTLRCTSGSPYQNMDMFILARPSRKTEAIFFTECGFNIFNFQVHRNSVNTFQSSSALYVYGSVESSHLEEFEI